MDRNRRSARGLVNALGEGQEVVAILAPTGKDATLAARVLMDGGLTACVCGSIPELASMVRAGCGAAIIAAEALAHPDVVMLEDALAAQEPWSDLPLVVLTPGGAHSTDPVAPPLHDVANVTILERPLRVLTLVYTLRAALRARRRQYEVRDYLLERARLESRLREGQRLESLGVLAGGIAHDFNNLLTPILGNAELLIEDGRAKPEHLESLHDIIEAANQAAKLTAQMLAYAGKGVVTMELVDVSAIVSTIARLLQGSITAATELALDLDEDLPAIRADVAQVQQVVMNLVLNAAESMDGRAGRVTLATALRRLERADLVRLQLAPTPGDYVQLTVADSGRGMDAPTLARIFEPFFSTKFAGRGLGLSAVYGIIRRHGGGLAIASSPGRGTTFDVYLPTSGDYVAATRPAPHAMLRGAAQRVLVVDDDVAVRRLVQSVLVRRGFDVVCAENGARALEQFGRHKGDTCLILLDATMPVMTGEQAIPLLKQLRPDVRIVVMSGYGAEAIAERHTDPAVLGYLAKPFTPDTLLEVVDSALHAVGPG